MEFFHPEIRESGPDLWTVLCSTCFWPQNPAFWMHMNVISNARLERVGSVPDIPVPLIKN